MNSTNSITPDSIGRRSLWVMFLLAFAFRLIYILQSSDNPLFGVPVVDAHSYAKWADRMAQGVWLWDYVGNYLPIYPAFLALQQIVFGSGPLINKIIQCLMGSLSAVLLAQAAARAWNRKIGLVTGYLVATNWLLVVFEAEKFAESFSIFFQSLTLWLLIFFPRRLWAVTAAGFAFALSAGARANLFLILPFILGWLIWKNRSQRTRAVTSAILFSIGTVLIMGPILERNYRLTGVPMLRAQGTWSLYSGISPEFEGLHPPTGILFNKYMDKPFQAGMRTVAEIERYWGRKILEVIRDDPGGIAANFFRRLLIFCNAREWSQEFDVYIYRSYSGFLSLPWPGFWLIGPFGFLGLLLSRRLSGNQWLVFGYTVIGILSIIPFKASDRYRLPTAALLTIFAAVALWQLYRWSLAAEKKKLYAGVAALGALCLVCWPDWPNLQARKTARHDFYIGLQNETNGRLDEAVSFYEASMNKFPWDPDSPYRIGHILFRRGEPERGMVFLREALKREPEFPKAMNEVARVYLGADRVADANEQARASLALNPVEIDTLLLMADIRRRQGNVAGEIDFLRRAALEAGDAASSMVLADRLIDLGDFENAIRLFERVMRFREAGQYLRVQAAMMAGITSIRFLNDTEKARTYWKFVLEQFKDFKFFTLQASYLNGAMDDDTFRRQIRQSEKWAAEGAYTIGLKRWAEGDMQAAAGEFKRCLADISDKESRPEKIPQKWAWEDLQRIREKEKN